MKTEIVDSMVKVGYKFVLEINKIISFSYSSETHCPHLLITSEMLLRVPSLHPPRSMSLQLNYSNNYLVEKGKEKIRELWNREKKERKGRK